MRWRIKFEKFISCSTFVEKNAMCLLCAFNVPDACANLVCCAYLESMVLSGSDAVSQAKVRQKLASVGRVKGLKNVILGE